MAEVEAAQLPEGVKTDEAEARTLRGWISGVVRLVAIAFALQINTFDILGSFFSADVIRALDSQVGQIGGVIITGLAASAGSSFWHDMLGRVRNIKEAVKQVEKVVAGKEG